ncbi:unnamed protein product [Closterium sp. NIES-53]
MGGCVSIEEDPRGRVGPAPSRSSSRATHSNRVAPQSPSTASKRSARKSSPVRSPSSASASAYRSGGLLPKSNESNASAASAGSGSGRRSCPQTPRGGSGGGFRTPPGSGGLGSVRSGGALADRTALANGGAAMSSLREFSYQELWLATRKFEKEGKLGEGGFGSVFRGTIEEDVCASGTGMGAGIGEGGRRKLQVAVKVLNQGGQQGETEWKTEVRYLSELRHPNLVRLVGYCSDGHHRLLAYEYLPYGSLERFLFTRAIQPLPWAVRMKVALHAAQGLAYLHEEADRQIIYRDFKASNILLDEDFNAKLSDFGLAKDGPEGNQTHVSTRVMGTYGYAAPEYMMTGHLTAKSDVYSFGVVLLEMISGRRAMEPEFPRRQQNIVEWARPFLLDPAKMLLLVDPRVGGNYSVKGAQRAAVLARKCLNKDPHARPLMSEAVRVLSSIQNLIDIASKMEQAQRLHGA